MEIEKEGREGVQLNILRSGLAFFHLTMHMRHIQVIRPFINSFPTSKCLGQRVTINAVLVEIPEQIHLPTI